MKVVLLAGGLGTRLREETEYRPKPMVPIGGFPILWHIMKSYAHHGHKEFIICLGYKGEVIKDYFRNYKWNSNDISFRLGDPDSIDYHNTQDEEDWQITLLETGYATQTGGRLKRAIDHIEDETFLLTYGDGLIDSDINASIEFHRSNAKIATMTAVRPAGRFGDIRIDDGLVTRFMEKPEDDGHLINGGFFVLDRRVRDYLTDDTCVFEREPLNRLTEEGQMAAYEHHGFWQCMDTYREHQMLNGMWDAGNAPWKLW